jgi:hypothetical protein
MLRNSTVLIAVLTLIVIGASPAKAQTKSAQKQCYNAQTCETECRRTAVGKNCAKTCSHKAAMLPACK